MNSAELKRAKRTVRHETLAARDSLPPDVRVERSFTIATSALAIPEIHPASAVMAFWSFGSEVDTAPLIERLNGRGVRVAIPRIVGADLEARTFVPGDPVTPTAFGAFEPADGESLDPAALDVVLTPGVAFDRSGSRIGYGGGFYDRLFRRTRPDVLRVGIAFDLQVRDDELPAGHFDLRVDLIVTESETVRCARTD
jgi:5-formyltetrahydrofolate cyclo-ligase